MPILCNFSSRPTSPEPACEPADSRGFSLTRALFWHQLRRPGKDTDYKVPSGGLFSMVCCPHYLCELLAWAGVCVVFNHAVALGIMSFFLLYLLGRSRATLRWYHDKMERKIPQGWCALVPFVW